MTARPQIKGWCPGALRPMAAEDGLVVRIRPWGSEINCTQALALADLATRFANGTLELTSRANVQLRGVDPGHLAELQAELQAQGWLDASPEVETRRNVILSPLRNGQFDGPKLARDLTRALAAADAPRLPAKFGFVLDTGSQRLFSGVSGDIRLEPSDCGMMLRAQGVQTGCSIQSETEAVARILDLAHWFVQSGGIGPDGRGRMKEFVKSHLLPQDLQGTLMPLQNQPAVVGALGDGQLVGLRYGVITSDALRRLATQFDWIRITPFRALYLPAGNLPDEASFLTDPADPFLRVRACTGAPGCPQAHGITRGLADTIISALPSQGLLHISGCTKGCAHPAPAAWTLVARDGAYDLVTGGNPWDDPVVRGVPAAGIPNLMRDL